MDYVGEDAEMNPDKEGEFETEDDDIDQSSGPAWDAERAQGESE